MIKYNLVENAYVSIVVYDILGEQVSVLRNKQQAAGHYQVMWNGNNKYGQSVSSGIYYFQIRIDDNNYVRKGLLLK